MNNVRGEGGVMYKGEDFFFFWVVRGARIVSPGGSSIFYAATQTNETRATRNKGRVGGDPLTLQREVLWVASH